jgi:hypothetical protein
MQRTALDGHEERKSEPRDQDPTQGFDSDDSALQQENEDLRTATGGNDNIVMELTMSGHVRYLSDCWDDIVGIPSKKIIKKPISKIILGDEDDKNVFVRATHVMVDEDISYRVRFVVRMGNIDRLSAVHGSPKTETSTEMPIDAGEEADEDTDEDDFSTGFDYDDDEEYKNRGSSHDPISMNKLDPSDEHRTSSESSDTGDLKSIASSISLDNFDSELLLELEGQGIVIRHSGKPSHVSFLFVCLFVWPHFAQVFV